MDIQIEPGNGSFVPQLRHSAELQRTAAIHCKLSKQPGNGVLHTCGIDSGTDRREKRRLLNFVLSNCSWEDGEAVATFRQTFDLLAETTDITARLSAGADLTSSKNEIWLGW